MMNKLVSILVVSYNAEKYIEMTLLSCLNQTYSDFEVLILDNDSQDRTVEIIEQIALKNTRLKIIKSVENIGPYAGLNLLLNHAHGEYIAIQDHDDIWFPDKLMQQVEFLEKNKEFIACGTNTFYFYESRNILILNQKLPEIDFVDHTSLMFRNNNFRYNPDHTLSDEHFEKIILSRNGKIGCIQDNLTIHRIKCGGGNLSSTRFSFNILAMRDFLSVNTISLGSFFYLLQLFFERFFSERIIWFLRKKITQRNRQWISLNLFQAKYPDVRL